MTIATIVVQQLHRYCQMHHYNKPIYFVRNCASVIDLVQVQNWLSGQTKPSNQSIYKLVNGSDRPLSWWLQTKPSTYSLDLAVLDVDVGRKRLRQSQIKHHWSQHQLANQFMISEAALHKYLNETSPYMNTLSIPNLIRVAEVFNCSVDDLCYRRLVTTND